MSDARFQQHTNGPMALRRVLSLPRWAIGLGYTVGYVLLDRISYIDPFASYGITPWNPPTGLSFVVVLLFGQRMIPFLFIAPFLADVMVRHLPLPWPLEIAAVTIIGGGYTLGLLFLLRPRTRFNPTLPSLRDLFLLLLVGAISAATVAMSYVGAVIAGGLLPASDFIVPFLRFWVGDMIGIAVVAPFTMLLLTRRRLMKPSLETGVQLVAVVGALWSVFGLAQQYQMQFFYILFLPVVWMAVRGGLEGVTVGILLTQLGLIVGVHLLPVEMVEVTALQALMLVLTMSGLMAGALVTEHRRTEVQLRLHQDSLSKLSRLASMGELAAAVAHEINQPLMAAGTYSRLICDALRRGGADDPSIAETAGKIAIQVERASEVVRNLRALVRLDQTGRAPTSIERIVNEALDVCRPDLDLNGIRVRLDIAGNLPPVLVDLLQIEQVLLNLIRNSIEAMKEAGHKGGVITIEARQPEDDVVEVVLSDTGPGFPAELPADQFPPFSSTKADGLGIGLSLSKTIIEAHGGRLVVGGSPQGAIIRLTLPAAKAQHA